MDKTVIFFLADGREITASHNGELLLWEPEDLDALWSNFARFGHPYFTTDLKHYDVDYESLHRRFPRETLVAVKGFITRSTYRKSEKDHE